MAQNAGYNLKYNMNFNQDMYPGYENRRGIGKNAGQKFPCNDAMTFAFAHQKYWQQAAFDPCNKLEESK